MGRYRVVTTLVYELETDKEHTEAVKLVEDEFDQLFENKDILRRAIKLEKLRERRHNIQIGVFKPEDVLPFISYEELKREYAVGDKTYSVRMNSQRYFIFRESLRCVACGLEGTQMILEQNLNDKSPHFNLYAEENGRLILMTKDHVQPKAFGGADRHSNYQTMCAICNNLKGHARLTLESIAELRKLYNANKTLPRKKLRILLDDAKKRLALPRKEVKVSGLGRKRLQAQLKAKEQLVANVDIHVWKVVDGTLVGRSVYEHELHGAELVASIKEGTELTPLRSQETRVAVKLSDTAEFWIYQGYVDYKESHEEKVLQQPQPPDDEGMS